MGMIYEETKRRKLKLQPTLRIMNTIGMIAWRNDGYGEAEQRLRLIHPLSWLWIVIMLLVSLFSQGVPDTLKDLKYNLENETVWI